jgi:hypothetical protein
MLELAGAVTLADGLNQIQSTARLAQTRPIQESSLASGRDLHRYAVRDPGRPDLLGRGSRCL